MSSIVICVCLVLQAILNVVLSYRVRDLNRKLNETYDECCLQYGYIDRLRQRIEKLEIPGRN